MYLFIESEISVTGNTLISIDACVFSVASFPVPRPAFCRLQYRTASDEKLGDGLGTRLYSVIGWCSCLR